MIQALSYHEWALGVRGTEVVAAANYRAFWALGWFLTVYFLGPARALARALPRPPSRWSSVPVVMLSPPLLLWGLACAAWVVAGSDVESTSAEGVVFLSFPMVLLVAGALLIVTGRQPDKPQPALAWLGVAVVAFYLMIWMFNGKRSHSLIAVLVGVCAFYIPRLKRPSFPVLVVTAALGMMAVGVSIGWRYYSTKTQTKTLASFVDFVSSFDPESVLESLNMKDRETAPNAKITHETEEYGGFLLMMDTVPARSDYDYGMNYIRVFSTFIPRFIWFDKPIYGRDAWTAAWVAGSEMKRESNFTGPAIGILGATQLNGGDVGTVIVIACVALLLKTFYEYFRLHARVPWVQVFWPLTYYNAWFMVMNDDPCNWFYYNWGFTTAPVLVLFWLANLSAEGRR